MDKCHVFLQIYDCNVAFKGILLKLYIYCRSHLMSVQFSKFTEAAWCVSMVTLDNVTLVFIDR